MWLKIVYNEEDSDKDIKKIFIGDDLEAPIGNDGSYRLSPIFPLVPPGVIPDLSKTTIHFFSFKNAYRVLGRVERKGSKKLTSSIFFSVGLPSIILISSDKALLDEFNEIANANPEALEKWMLQNGVIVEKAQKKLNGQTALTTQRLSYKRLPVTDRALVDEFYIAINFILPKLTAHMPSETDKIERLVSDVNILVDELIYLNAPSDSVPDSLSEYSRKDLENAKINVIIRNQNLDRIIQVNSALSYISTQAFSGAIPILERRSLIRRYSLLGIGSAILALNSVARFIENAFSSIPFNEIILKSMSLAKPLIGLDNLPEYDSGKWNQNSIDIFSRLSKNVENPHYKLPYFSGRLGFRETEYSISAAIQSITSGASLEWSLMTLTHEMLHGHVRKIVTGIFYGEDHMSREQQRIQFHQRFVAMVRRTQDDFTYVESIRHSILAYCCQTVTHGSITALKSYDAKTAFDFKIPDNPQLLWELFERQNRNISEIFVHVLDLHYFYNGRLAVYIPLIWRSWIAVPHISGDINQYILRSLLAIASTLHDKDVAQRFNLSKSIFEEILEQHKETVLKFPIIAEILETLADEQRFENFFTAFKASLILVDLATQIFISKKIRQLLFNDPFVRWEKSPDEGILEERLIYELPQQGFNDEKITSPIAYLLDKMVKELQAVPANSDDLERETAIQFLALNSIHS
jgi:hypothetical protein